MSITTEDVVDRLLFELGEPRPATFERRCAKVLFPGDHVVYAKGEEVAEMLFKEGFSGNLVHYTTMLCPEEAYWVFEYETIN